MGIVKGNSAETKGLKKEQKSRLNVKTGMCFVGRRVWEL